MEQLPGNVQDIFDRINWFLILAQMVALYLGVKKFRQVPLVGSWFRWKAFGYTLIVFVADMVAFYFLWQGDPFFLILRLTCARVVILWETLYCFYYRFDRLPAYVKMALTEPWLLDPTMPRYEHVWEKLLRYAHGFLQRRRRTDGIQCSGDPDR